MPIYLSQGLQKGRLSYWRSLQPSKENIQQKNAIYYFYSIFVGNFCPPGFGSVSTTLIVKYIALNPKDKEKILSLQEGAEIKTFFFLHIDQRLENLPNLGPSTL
jgi:hypothetical protein